MGQGELNVSLETKKILKALPVLDLLAVDASAAAAPMSAAAELC
jgi:hypothetical protein